MGRGVLRPDLAASVLRLDRHKPTDALAPFVDYYWIPRWDLRGRPPFEQTILPHPNVHLVLEASGPGRPPRWSRASPTIPGCAGSTSWPPHPGYPCVPCSGCSPTTSGSAPSG